MDQSYIRSGILLKRSRNRTGLSLGTNWQSRKISLFSDRIAYSTPDGIPKDTFPITVLSSVANCSVDGKDYCLKILTGSDELILAAKDPEERDDWSKSLLSTISTTTNTEITDSVKDMAIDAASDAAKDVAKDALAGAMSGGVSGFFSRGMSALANAADAALDAAADAAAAAAEEALKAAAAEAARVLFAKEEEERRIAAEARAKLLAVLHKPILCQKKLSTESSFQKRFVWVDPATKEFCWSKSEEDLSKAKRISIPQHIRGVAYNTMPGVVQPNLVIELVDEKLLPTTVFSKMFSSAMPSSIDIYMDDADTCSGLVKYITELRV